MQTEQTDGRKSMTWSDVDWTTTEAVVRRIQERIFRAAKAGDGAQVANLQKLLVRSRSAKLLAIRQVTQLRATSPLPCSASASSRWRTSCYGPRWIDPAL